MVDFNLFDPPPEKVPAPKHLDKNEHPYQILSLNLVLKNKHHIFLVRTKPRGPKFINVVNWAYSIT